MKRIFIFYSIVILFKFTNSDQRIDCYPESESSYSNYSKESCLARHCFYDDQPTFSPIQCYLSQNYGYILQETLSSTGNNLRYRLKRNEKISSPFPEPIDNVILEVQYYTNEIIRVKFTDADQQRYEVGFEREGEGELGNVE